MIGKLISLTKQRFVLSVSFLSIMQSPKQEPVVESSPRKRKAISEIKLKATKTPINTLYSIHVHGACELFWAESSPGQDSKTFPLFASVRDRGRFAVRNNIIMIANRRQNLHNEVSRRNTDDNYPRRFYVRVAKENEYKPRERYEFLLRVQEVSCKLHLLCQRHRNNCNI